MSKKLNDEDLRKHLKEQIYFLQSSAKLYDLGNEVEAKRMATVLRVLLFESPNPNSKSKSLLGQLHLRRSMQFFDTAQPYQSNNLLTQQCLENPPKNDVVYASMRQMTFEMLQSLYRVRPALFDECYF